VFFKDKGPSASSGTLGINSVAYRQALDNINSRALARRSKVLPQNALLDADDLPLCESYIDQIRNLGGKLVEKSRWLNAASFYLSSEQISAAVLLAFVKEIKPVTRFRSKHVDDLLPSSNQSFQKLSSLDYGSSFDQVQMISVPVLHDLGITGRGILVGMLDAGFRWKVHEALQTRHIIAEHDFINNDDNTANESNDAYNQDEHGTLTFSVIGGYKQGKLIGPAFDADFILGKTEYVPSGYNDYHWEEDKWAAAIEWMEGNGVDVVSSSVGYNTFLDGVDYTWEHRDFDGRTSVVAKAAAHAARLGVVVCNSMGNEGHGIDTDTVGTLLTPADADSIISVGAVMFSRRLWYLSSQGPTSDGRIKPEITAPGVHIYHASVPGPNTYGYSDGTSLATPLAAGAAALLLSARPELTPIQVRDALCSNADTIDTGTYPSRPNNFTGWGLVNAFNAVLSFGPVFSNKPTASIETNLNTISTVVISKFGINPATVYFHYNVGTDSMLGSFPMMIDSSMFYQTSGRYKVTIPQQAFRTPIRFYIEAKDSALNYYRSPAPITGSQWLIYYGDTGVRISPTIPERFSLKQNYPNPFNSGTMINFDLPQREHVVIKVYNFLGQLVTTILDDMQDAGDAQLRQPIMFDGSNVPSGVYFYRIITPSFSSTKKMILIR